MKKPQLSVKVEPEVVEELRELLEELNSFSRRTKTSIADVLRRGLESEIQVLKEEIAEHRGDLPPPRKAANESRRDTPPPRPRGKTP